MDTESDKIRSEKSSRYPAIELEYAIEVIQEARKWGKRISDVHLAGDKSIKSGAYVAKKAALGYYGLISGRGTELEITELADRIIYPSSDNEELIAIQEAFLNPSIFQSVYSSTEKQTPISLDVLGNIIVRNYGIQPGSKDKFLARFINSGKFAGLIDQEGNKIVLKALENSGLTTIEEKENPLASPSKSEEVIQAQEITPNQAVELILENGQKARIIVPAELSKRDTQKLIAQIKILANIFDE